MKIEEVPGSYRDRAGFVFHHDGILYRQVNRGFREHFDHFVQSGVYDELCGERLLVPHTVVDLPGDASPDAYTILRPELVPFVSYPYEWAFTQLKDAALLTLDVQQRALRRGMILRDASAYNVQWRDGRPVFIDTLSFGVYTDGQPWYGYRQFCEHFLAPLLLMARCDVRLGMLHRDFADGVPLELASRLLGRGSWLRPSPLLHLHLHARMQARHANSSGEARKQRLEKPALVRLVDHLRATVEDVSWTPTATEWAGYEDDHSYSAPATESKRRVVAELLARVRPQTTWDLGANTGAFSRIAAAQGSRVLSMDADPGAVELNYLRVRKEEQSGVLPLVMDLMNPSPASGWAHRERASLAERGPADAVLALALVHHLALSRNVPLERIAAFFRQIGRAAVVEFVPPDDSQAQRLLAQRPEQPHPYTREEFERRFSGHFTLREHRPIEGSGRSLYLWTADG